MPNYDQQFTKATAPNAKNGERAESTSYLNHGVESLVAMDNPDDSQLGAPGKPGRGAGQGGRA